jgi:CDP-diacylglycerol--serine O-phosphatidyltransferase
MTSEREQEGTHGRHMLGFTRDLPNLMTLAGLCCGMLAIYFASFQLYPAAMIALLWAAFFDWFDGPVAKLIQDRGNEFMAFGAQLDSLADLVSAGVAPAFILLSVGSDHPVFLVGALYLVCAGAIRLAYFNIYGLKEDGTYSGVPIGVNIILMPLIFLLHGIISADHFHWIVYGTVVLGATLNIAPIRFAKLTGAWYVAVACLVLILSVYYVMQLI